jgi:anti-sigma factor RsiW
MTLWKNCPDAAVLAAYVDAVLLETERADVESHLAACDRCAAAVAAVVRAGAREPADVPPALLARARALGRRPATPATLRWVAAAAVLMLAVAVGVVQWRPSISPSPAAAGDARETRNTAAAIASAPVVVTPVDDDVLPQGPVQVRWTGVPGTAFYQIRIAAEDGGLVWEGRADAGRVEQAIDAPLERGRRYYVTVTAHAASQRAQPSKAIGFAIGTQAR